MKFKANSRLNQDLVSGAQADLLLRKISQNFDERFKQKSSKDTPWRSSRTQQEFGVLKMDDPRTRTPDAAATEKAIPVRGVLRYADLVAHKSNKQSEPMQPFDPSQVVVTKPIMQGQVFFEALDQPRDSPTTQSSQKLQERLAKPGRSGRATNLPTPQECLREGAPGCQNAPSADITFRPPNYQASENSLKSLGWHSTYLNVMNEHHSTPSKFKRHLKRVVKESIEEASTLNRYERASRKQSSDTDTAQAKGSLGQFPQKSKELSDGQFAVNLEDLCSKTQSLRNERGQSFFGEPRTLDWSDQAALNDRRLDDTRSGPPKAHNMFLMIGKQSPRPPHGTRTSLSEVAAAPQDLKESRTHSSKDYRIQEPDLPSFDAKFTPVNPKSPAATYEIFKDTLKNIDLFSSMQELLPADKQNPSQATNAESSLPIDFINTFNSKDIQFLKEPISNKPVSTKKILYDFESLDCFTKNKAPEEPKPAAKPVTPPEIPPKKTSPQRATVHQNPKPLLATSKLQYPSKLLLPTKLPPPTQRSISPPKSRLKTPPKNITSTK